MQHVAVFGPDYLLASQNVELLLITLSETDDWHLATDGAN